MFKFFEVPQRNKAHKEKQYTHSKTKAYVRLIGESFFAKDTKVFEIQKEKIDTSKNEHHLDSSQ